VNQRADALERLGLDKAPEARLPGLWEQDAPPPGKALLNFKKALQLVDPIETASFEKYIPDGVVIDQAMDTRAFNPEASRCVMLRTDQPIPSNYRVFRSTGIGTEPNTNNHYMWLAQELGRHILELGARAISPPLIFRTSGSNGTVPFIGLIMKMDTRPADGMTVADQGANWGLLGQRAPEVRLDEDETIEDVK
jgi:hypothetical protein